MKVGKGALEKAEAIVELLEMERVEDVGNRAIYVLNLKNAAGLPKPIDVVQFGDVESKKLAPETQVLKDGIVSLEVEFEEAPDFKQPCRLRWNKYDLELEVVVK